MQDRPPTTSHDDACSHWLLQGLVAQLPQVEFGNRLVSVAKHDPVHGPIPPRVAPNDDKVYARDPWTLQDSVFKDWNADLENICARGFEEDWRLCKIRKFVKDDEQQALIKAYIKPKYKAMKAIFKRYVACPTRARP